MDLSSPNLINLSNQNEGTFNVTMTSLIGHAGLTMSSFSGTETEQGCLILKEKFNPMDNPENIISKQVHFWISTVNYAGIIPLLFLVGVPGNILSAAVFYKQGLRERINFCIFFLALDDLVVIFITVCAGMEKTYRSLVGPFSFFIRHFPGLTGVTWVSMFLSAVIAAERCFCVVSPLRAQRMLSTCTMAGLVTSISLILVVGMLAIAGSRHTEVCIFDPWTNTTSLIIGMTKYYTDNKEILDIFAKIVYSVVLTGTFFIFIVITTIITTIKLKSAFKWRQQSSSASGTQSISSSESQMVALTWMLVATSVLFVVCTSPVLMVQLAEILVPELANGDRYYNLWSLLWSIIDVCRCVNSSLNFFIYYLMGSRFRQTLRQLLCCKEMDVQDTLQSTKHTERTK